MGKVKYDWPPIEGLVAFVRKHSAQGAAERLGVPVTTLRSHLRANGVTAEDYAPPKALNDDALRELHDLIK